MVVVHLACMVVNMCGAFDRRFVVVLLACMENKTKKLDYKMVTFDVCCTGCRNHGPTGIAFDLLQCRRNPLAYKDAMFVYQDM